MKPISSLYWDDENVGHLEVAHHVTADEVEEVVFGVPGEEPTYRVLRDGEFYVVLGETGDGRLLKIVGEFVEDGRFRPFAAANMNSAEKRSYRKG